MVILIIIWCLDSGLATRSRTDHIVRVLGSIPGFGPQECAKSAMGSAVVGVHRHQLFIHTHGLSIRSKLYPPRDIRIPNILKSHEPTPFWCGGSLLDYPIHVEVGATGTVGTPIQLS